MLLINSGLGNWDFMLLHICSEIKWNNSDLLQIYFVVSEFEI